MINEEKIKLREDIWNKNNSVLIKVGRNVIEIDNRENIYSFLNANIIDEDNNENDFDENEIKRII
jgi:hypothetical protein